MYIDSEDNGGHRTELSKVQNHLHLSCDDVGRTGVGPPPQTTKAYIQIAHFTITNGLTSQILFMECSNSCNYIFFELRFRLWVTCEV